MATKPSSALSTLYLDAQQTDALVQAYDPETELRRLGLSSIKGFLPSNVGEWKDMPISGDVRFNMAVVIVVNRTGKPLIVADTAYPDGNLDYEAWDDLKADRRIAAAPREELGEHASCVGIWKFSEGGHNPSFAIKFDATSATGNRPVYVAGDITKPLIGWPTLSCSVGNFDHGSAQDYFDQFVDGGSDYGKSSSSSGCVSAKGRETRWVYGSGDFLSEWVICAVVSGT